MDATGEEIARRAAQRLTGIDANLPAVVEARLRSADVAPERYEAATLIALAGLVLEVVKFAWDIYRDLKKQSLNPAPEVIGRRLRVELKMPAHVSDAERDAVIAAVLEELPR